MNNKSPLDEIFIQIKLLITSIVHMFLIFINRIYHIIVSIIFIPIKLIHKLYTALLSLVSLSKKYFSYTKNQLIKNSTSNTVSGLKTVVIAIISLFMVPIMYILTKIYFLFFLPRNIKDKNDSNTVKPSPCASFENIYLLVLKKPFVLIRIFIMPTRTFSELVKFSCKDKFKRYMHHLTHYSLFVSVSILFIFYVIDEENTHGILKLIQSDISYLHIIGISTVAIVSFFSISRILEITYAFIRDSHSQLLSNEKYQETYKEDKSDISFPERINLAIFSYLELIFQFAILYYLFYAGTCYWLETGSFNKLMNATEAIYFSGVTITTLGYGDTLPTILVSKLAIIFEVMAGFTLIIVSFTVYVSKAMAEIGEDITNKKKN